MITVKLEHTPLHKTVAELAELFKPAPSAVRAEPGRQKDGEGKKRKSQAGENRVNNEESPKKRRKTQDTHPDDATKNGTRTPKPKRSRPSKATEPNNDGADPAANEDAQRGALLNLSPSEAARRRDEAVRKLSEAGIDPSTLSSEQFDIFSNQSPDLQTESLAMLVKYGAERLRIVHPNKDNSSSSPAPANGATPDGSAKKNKSRKRGFNPDGTPKVKKTRGSCQTCRTNKIKVSVYFNFPFRTVLTLAVFKSETSMFGVHCSWNHMLLPTREEAKPDLYPACRNGPRQT